MAMRWHGDEALRRIRDSAGRQVDMASRFIRDRARELVSRDQAVTIYARGGGRSRAGLDPSRPGEPPKKVTGTLRRGIAQEYMASRLEARVGTNVPYGKHLELGTRRMAARPWLGATIRTYQAELRGRFESTRIST